LFKYSMKRILTTSFNFAAPTTDTAKFFPIIYMYMSRNHHTQAIILWMKQRIQTASYCISLYPLIWHSPLPRLPQNFLELDLWQTAVEIYSGEWPHKLSGTPPTVCPHPALFEIHTDLTDNKTNSVSASSPVWNTHRFNG
jgi:hypothetical protein